MDTQSDLQNGVSTTLFIPIQNKGVALTSVRVKSFD